MPSASSSAGGAVQLIDGRPASSASDRIASIAACICSWPNITAPSMTSSDSIFACDSTISTASLRAGDDEVELRVLELRGASGSAGIGRSCSRRVRAPIGPMNGKPGQAQRGRGAEHRRDVRSPPPVFIDITGGDDLDFALEALREQRANRTVDQTRRQRLLLARPAFALEEAARDAAGGVGLLLIVDGQREEVAARDVLLVADRGHEDDRVGHVDEDGAVGLTCDDAGFDGDVMGAVLEGSAGSHVCLSLTNGRDAPTSGSRRSTARLGAGCSQNDQSRRTGSDTENLRSTPQTEAADQLLITALVGLLEVVQQLAALVHHLEQAAARVVVFLVTREVVGELGDPRGEQSDLNFRETRVGRRRGGIR